MLWYLIRPKRGLSGDYNHSSNSWVSRGALTSEQNFIGPKLCLPCWNSRIKRKRNIYCVHVPAEYLHCNLELTWRTYHIANKAHIILENRTWTPEIEIQIYQDSDSIWPGEALVLVRRIDNTAFSYCFRTWLAYGISQATAIEAQRRGTRYFLLRSHLRAFT